MERQKIKLIKSLGDKKSRVETKLFVIEGIKMLEDMLRSSFTISEIFYTEKLESDFTNHFSKIKSEKISISDMDRITFLKSATPVLALINMPTDNTPMLYNDRLSLALDCVQDPGNLGTIIRICDWFGIKQIYLSEDSADAYNPKVVQATMGAIARVKMIYCDLQKLLSKAKQETIPLYVTALDGQNIYIAPLSSTGIIVMGNEGKGVSHTLQNMADAKLRIPSFPAKNECESLNVSVATAIVCSEFRRRC
ncbi:MAG: RNA methyltransferase [Rikenellaceae bacterium]